MQRCYYKQLDERTHHIEGDTISVRLACDITCKALEIRECDDGDSDIRGIEPFHRVRWLQSSQGRMLFKSRCN